MNHNYSDLREQASVTEYLFVHPNSGIGKGIGKVGLAKKRTSERLVPLVRYVQDLIELRLAVQIL